MLFTLYKDMLKKHEFLNVLEFIMISLNISMNDIFKFMDINTMFIILQRKIHSALQHRVKSTLKKINYKHYNSFSKFKKHLKQIII